MFKAAGAAVLLFGAWGFACSICRERKKRLLFLKEMREIYRLLQNEICYTALPLPEIFKTIAERVNPPFDKTFLLIGENMTLEKGENFRTVWEREMGKALNGIPLTRQQKMLLIGFPECMGISESRGQARAVERYVEELDRMILQQEEEEKSKNKVIMSLGIAAGLFAVIILL